jgi:hypothetical protein
MPMIRNIQSNRVYEDWTVIFLQSVLFSIGFSAIEAGVSPEIRLIDRNVFSFFRCAKFATFTKVFV